MFQLAKLALALTMAGAVCGAQASVPVVSSLTSGYSFQEYAGRAPVGAGRVGVDSTLFYIDEKTVNGLKSWLIFFDPAGRQDLNATLTFSHPVTAVFTSRGELQASAVYTADSVNYLYRPLTGLEREDNISWQVGSTSVNLAWIASNPGDHIRVVTAVPEPGTYAMFVAGLGVIVWLMRRQRRG